MPYHQRRTAIQSDGPCIQRPPGLADAFAGVGGIGAGLAAVHRLTEKQR